jgi:hypothetical protein
LLECRVEGDRGGDMRVFELIEYCRLLALSVSYCGVTTCPELRVDRK